MTDEEKAVIEKWILSAIPNSDVVPNDEGNMAALTYNLIHLLREGPNFRRYAYSRDQDEELHQLGVT